MSDSEAAARLLKAGEASRTTAVEHFLTPAEMGDTLEVPQMGLRIQGELALFDDPELLEHTWTLSPHDAMPTSDDLAALGAALKVAEGGEIDVESDSGRVVSRFLPNLQRDLGLSYKPEHWDQVRLAAWLCRNLPELSIVHPEKLAFVSSWLSHLLARREFDAARVNQQKFLIRQLIERTVRRLRTEAVAAAFQTTLFGPDSATRIAVGGPELMFRFHPQAYAPVRDYDFRFGSFDFRRHYYDRIGDFDSREEFACACEIDTLAQKGRFRFWVRNLVRREACSFFLQKASGRFYPDFVCLLPNDSVLLVEYKGGDRWKDAVDDRQIGALWEELSEGRGRFVMVRDQQWQQIIAKLP